RSSQRSWAAAWTSSTSWRCSSTASTSRARRSSAPSASRRTRARPPLGIRLGSTENAAICTELLQDLVTRSLRLDGPVLSAIDGANGLRKALEEVLGTRALIHRCHLHKQRTLLALVPQRRQPFVRAALRRAYRAVSASGARRQLQTLTNWLESNGHPDAAASLREGLEETLTVLKLDLPRGLRRFFATPHCIEKLLPPP